MTIFQKSVVNKYDRFIKEFESIEPQINFYKFVIQMNIKVIYDLV